MASPMPQPRDYDLDGDGRLTNREKKTYQAALNAWKKGVAQEGKSQRTSDRQEGRNTRTQTRQDSRTDRTYGRQDGRTNRTQTRQDARTDRTYGRQDARTERALSRDARIEEVGYDTQWSEFAGDVVDQAAGIWHDYLDEDDPTDGRPPRPPGTPSSAPGMNDPWLDLDGDGDTDATDVQTWVQQNPGTAAVIGGLAAGAIAYATGILKV